MSHHVTLQSGRLHWDRGSGGGGCHIEGGRPPIGPASSGNSCRSPIWSTPVNFRTIHTETSLVTRARLADVTGSGQDQPRVAWVAGGPVPTRPFLTKKSDWLRYDTAVWVYSLNMRLLKTVRDNP